MKKYAAFLFFIFFPLMFITAQESDLYNWDIDSLFDEPPPETADSGQYDTGSISDNVLSAIMKPGITFNASYGFYGGISPGWDKAPWHFDGNEKFSWGQGILMNSGISLDARISESFRVFTSFSLQIPGSGGNIGTAALGNFYFDYDLFKALYIRAGKYGHSWGISLNFGFTNLLSRIPEGGAGGSSYIFKVDIPIGVGGIQALAMTRSDITGGVIPGFKDIGFGLKYNLALRQVDFDLGAFYQQNMATRGFLSVKTTIFDVELYNEWLLAVNTHSDFGASFAANLGFVKEFFGTTFTVNGEFFYNGEKSSNYYMPETSLETAGTLLPGASAFSHDITIALNLLYRAGGWGSVRLFLQTLYSPLQSSAQLIPGIRITPFPHAEIYMAVPVALGSEDSLYYRAAPAGRPFSFVFLISLSGSVKASFN
ncbi:MAG: hypothetical protein FWC17_01390 [Treponema sp.]|nr:hypothetical protein [Treponema sp.]